MKKVGLTYDLKTDYKFERDDPPDANAEFDHPSTIDVISSAIKSQGFEVESIGNVSALLHNRDSLGVDIVFNISEGLYGRNRESQVPLLLEMMGIPFVGADALTLGVTLDKVIAKKIFIAEGILTPKFFEVKTECDIDLTRDLEGFSFPLIVKPRFEGSSKGLTESSRVENNEILLQQIRHIIQTYRQPALIEEFISGKEFTVAIIGNDDNIEVMPVVQIKIDGRLELGERFYTYEHINSGNLDYVCPAEIDESLKKKITELAVQTYKAVECRDFGRIDFRVDEKGQPYVLEINPLPSLSSEDVFMVVAEAIGISYNEMIGRILHKALKRHNLLH